MELKCPKCGTLFTIDDAGCASIINQIKTSEVNAEVERRLSELRKQHEIEKESAILREVQKAERVIAQREQEIASLRVQVNNFENAKRLEVAETVAQKEQEICELKNKIVQNDSKHQIAMLQLKSEADAELQAKNAEIERLNNKIVLNESGIQTRRML